MEGIAIVLVGIGIVIGFSISILISLLESSKTPSTTPSAIASLGIEVGDTVLFTTESTIDDYAAREVIADYCSGGDEGYYKPSDSFIKRVPIIFLDSNHTPKISAIIDDESNTFIGDVVGISEHSFILRDWNERSYFHIGYTDKCAGYKLS